MSFVRLNRALAGALLLGLLAGCATVPMSEAGSAPVVDASVGGGQTAVMAPIASASVPPAAEPAATAPAPSQPPGNLLVRIQAGFQLPELPDRVLHSHIRRITSNPEYLERVFDRGGRYLHHIMEEIDARKMPSELALLPIVESAFNPEATSRAKAAGLWQFMPATGRAFELSQDWWRDERRDIIESTRAALEYLDKIHTLHNGDWFLALASYNRGENAVMRAVKANRARGKPADFLSIQLPRETRHYVPALVALRNVLRDPQRYGVKLPHVEDRPYFTAIEKSQSVDLALAAEFAELPLTDFRMLNPQLRRPVITVSRTNRIILPIEKADLYQANLDRHQAAGKPLVSWAPYTLKKGESLRSLADKSTISPEELAQANGLKSPRQVLMPGTVLLAPIVSSQDDAMVEQVLARFSGAKTVERVQLPAKVYRVRKKDTLASIARRFGMSVATLKQLNNLTAEPKAGTRLTIQPSRTQVVVTDSKGAVRLQAR
jgi:membrane-bound lytic murein transglycosylase D